MAIKFLHEEFSKDAAKLNRFVQEAKAASALNHPNILTVYEIGETDGKNYIAAIGDKDKAIEHLDRGIDEHESEVVYIRTFHYYDFMRDDPRFKDMLKRLNLPE